ncbi:hypothetical protein [Alcanivorax sp. 24]|uniref:hypothetical protein n=1 Tax=Alcanivorax sp. 24 TaxID=2545266 RepID=UPI00106010F2|nr:hypothetical protein [Alcanivorax sp. 24]
MFNSKADGAGARPARPFVLLALLVGLALAAAQAVYFHQQIQHRQLQTAQADARGLAREWAGTLWNRAQRLEDRLTRLPGEIPVQRALAQTHISDADWFRDGRLRIVPDAAATEALSFTEQDLLQRLHEGGGRAPLVIGRGGESPALLAGRAVSGGALIIQQDLGPWMQRIDQRLPKGAQVRLIQDDVTLARRGQAALHGTALHGTNTASGEATQGTFTVRLDMPPPPPPITAWILPGGLGLGLILLALILPRLRRRPEQPEPAAQVSSPKPQRREPAAPKPAAPTVTQPPLPDDVFSGDGLVLKADPELLARLGSAFAALARDKHAPALCLASDDSEGADAVLDALRGGLLVEGIKTLDQAPCAEPLWRHGLETGATREGLYAHKHGDRWRLIPVLDGQDLSQDDVDTLRRYSAGTVAASSRRADPEPAPIDAYLRQLRDDIVLARPLRLALHAPPLLAPLANALFDGLGCAVVPAKTADALRRVVTEQNADIGILLDQRGNTLALVDHQGGEVASDQVLMLLARDLLSRHPGADVLFDVKCSRALPSLIRKQGGRPVLCAADPRHIAAERLRLGAPLAGEWSGRVFCADRWFGFADGFYTAARVLEILSMQEDDSATVFAGLASGRSTPLLRLPVPDDQGRALVSALRAEGRFPGGRAATVDGLRVEFPDGWGVVRLCPLQSVLEMRFEGRDTAALERVKDLFRDQLRAVSPDLALPF